AGSNPAPATISDPTRRPPRPPRRVFGHPPVNPPRPARQALRPPPARRTIGRMAPALGRSAVLAVLLLPLAVAAAGEGGAPLSAAHRAWLDEVEPLIGEDERAAFLALSADHLRSAFIDEFWRVRDPY